MGQDDNANRLVSADEESYTWDDNGNLLSDGVYAYTFSASNRLIAVSNSANETLYVAKLDEGA